MARTPFGPMAVTPGMVVELRDLRLDLTVLYDSLSFISRGRPTMFHETASENPLSWSYSTAVTLVAHRRAIQCIAGRPRTGFAGKRPDSGKPPWTLARQAASSAWRTNVTVWPKRPREVPATDTM